MIRFGLLWMFCFVSIALIGQQRTGQRDGNADFILPDTVNLQYFHLDDVDELHAYQDTSLNNAWHQLNPARKSPSEYAFLGNIGSAARPLLYDTRHRVGLHMGHFQYDLYNYELNELKIFDSNAPVTNAIFSPRGDETNFVVGVDFGRKFTDGTSLSINYDRYKHTGNYADQEALTTNFGTAFTYDHKSGYRAIFAFINNVNTEGQNGGVRDIDDLYTTSAGDRSLVDVNLSGAETRYQHRLYNLSQFFNYRTLRLRHDLAYESAYFKYFDELSTSVPDLYNDFLTDWRGIRYYTTLQSLKNKFTVGFDSKGIDMNVGAYYNYNRIDDERTTSAYNDAGIVGKVKLPILNGLILKSNATIGLLDATGDFEAKGEIDIELSKFFRLETGAKFYRYSSTWLDEHLSLNEVELWNNNFAKPLGVQLFGKLHIPVLNSAVTVSQTIENNSIFYEQGRPFQHDDAFTATSVLLENQIHLWLFHLENNFTAQFFSDNLYALPDYVFKHNFYIEKRLFKRVLQLRLGTEFRYIISNRSLEYHPITGVFSRGDQPYNAFPMLDAYITAKVSKFRFFGVLSNYTSYFQNETDRPVYAYPLYDSRIRIGISWLFLN